MRRKQTIKLSILFVCYTCLLPISGAKADIPAAEEWVDIPVVVNIIDATDANNVDTIIDRANDILKQAHIRLVVKKTNRNVNVGNGDGDLTEAEGDGAQEDGQTELEGVSGAGKGIKITIADDVWTEEPNTTGWSVHRNPVIFVEPDTDPNARGRTAAHEVGHVFTLDDTYDLNDINDLMYGYVGGGTNLDANDVNEIFTNAKKRGKAYFVMPRVLPGQSVAIPCGIDYSIDAHGAILDGFSDMIINDPYGIIIGPDCPCIQYADLREITLFCDEPFDLAGDTTLEIQLGGPRPVDWPADSFFDVFFSCHAECPPFGLAWMDVPASQPPTAGWVQLPEGSEIALPPPMVHENERFDGSTLIIDNHSLELTIPTELIAMNLVGAEPIIVNVNSHTDDWQVPNPQPIMIDDSTGPFEFGLTQPCACPRLCFSALGMSGCGFTGEVDIELDGGLVGSTTARADGTFMYPWDPTAPLEAGLHSVIAKELDDSRPTGAAYAAGYFNYSPVGEIAGDLDGDGDVDFEDFARFARNWLAGK